MTTDEPAAVVAPRGAKRLAAGHPWVYRSDVARRPNADAGAVAVRDGRGHPLGVALWNPRSEISLRLIDRDPNAQIDATWWHARLATAIARRAPLEREATAYRLVHAEGDGLPGLICDRYDRWLVVQLLSAGVEHYRTEIIDALRARTGAVGILGRHDVAVRRTEGLPNTVEVLHGEVPREIEVREGPVRYLVAPWDGQKTGAFLDQRENRMLMGDVARGRALDCFTYHGSFALHLARNATTVVALDSSAAALERGRRNAALNGITTVEFVTADAFEYLRAAERVRTRSARTRFDTIVLDPPAFAKSRSAVPGALRGYKEINLRAMRLLAPGGLLYTASCSFHVTKPLFLDMLSSAASDSGRRIAFRRLLTQSSDHPEILSIPETGYIKGAVLEALD